MGEKYTKTYVFKILLGGAGGVGRTTLLIRAINGYFSSNTSMTTGIDFQVLSLQYRTGEMFEEPINIKLSCYDFAGQDRWRFMQPPYTLGADAAILTYDLTRLRTLDDLDEWVNVFRSHDPTLPIIFVGTKLDRQSDIVVSDEYSEEFVVPLNLFSHIKISSRDGTNINRLFNILIRKIFERRGIGFYKEDWAEFLENFVFNANSDIMLANYRRLAQHIPLLCEKIALGIPLDAFDLAFPDYSRFVAYLDEYCAHYPTPTSIAVQKLLEQVANVKMGDKRILL